MRQASSDRRELLTDRLLGVAEFSHAHWFFGNLYEALVKIPDRLAASDASPGLPRTPLGAGSPGRYYAPIAPINAPAALAALMTGWNHSSSRVWLIVAAASSTTGAVATAYLLRSINPDLYFSPQPLSETLRKPLLKRWYTVHAVRLTASAVALAAIHQTRTTRLRSRG
jgi:hypothetical protein